MYQDMKEFQLKAIHDTITIQRDKNGVPTVTAKNREDLNFGIGFAHATDRMVQIMLVRAIAQGRASEKFAGTDELIEIDKYMRWLNLSMDTDAEMEKLEPEVKSYLEAYTTGINEAIRKNKKPLEFKLVGYSPEPWSLKDSLITVKVMGYIGLAQAQGDMQKFIIEMIQAGVSEAKIKALFPYIKEPINIDMIKSITLHNPIIPLEIWNSVLPSFRASNNWVISPDKTKSGKAMLGSDPHMEVNRLPALWYEMVQVCGESREMGITMPGVPVIVMGRSNHIAWGGTYGFMDMIDFFAEKCENEKYEKDGKWKDFIKRNEIISPKKKEPITLTFYENEHGVLEGDARVSGTYLSMAFTGRHDAGADIFNVLMQSYKIKDAKSAQAKFRNVSMPTFNWGIIDDNGSIAYQMNGKMPKRASGISGLLPIPGWESANDWQGFENPEKYPSTYNPEKGYFASANSDMNEFGSAKPINLPMASYRLQRINELLEKSNSVDEENIKSMHFDFYSKQAELLMPLIIPHLTDSENSNFLKNWDLFYNADSKAAMLFEEIYLEIIISVFGDLGVGRKTMDYLFTKTGIFTDFYGNFDTTLLDINSAWFQDKERDEIIKDAVERALTVEAKPYSSTRKFDMMNIFIGGKFPAFFGFDKKNLILPGNRSTIHQGQIYKNAGRDTTFSPSWRMIVDFAEEGIHTVIAGGPSGSRFSKWYTSDLKNWFEGKYKLIK